MRLLIGGIPYNERGTAALDAGSVRYKGTTADPVPTANVTLVDNTSSITIAPLAELIIIDEKVIANPTQNFLLGPALLSTDTSNWFQTSTIGFTGTVSFAGAPPVTASVTNAGTVGYILRAQNAQFGLVVPGQTYMLSGYIQIATPMNNAQSILKFGFLDVASNYLGDAAADYRSTTASGGRVRVSMSAVAPANAASIQVAFGIQTTAQPTNSGTALFDTIQLEPMWFPSIISYPSPDCLPTSANCRTLPNETTIRQYRKFGGLVVNAIYGEYQGNKRTIQITANGYAWLTSGCFTATSFVNTNDSAIMTSLLNAAFPPRLDGTQLFNTSAATVITGNQIDILQPNWDDLRSIFNSFAAQAGYFHTADAYWNYLYQPPGYTQMPIALIADNSGNPDNIVTFPIYGFKAEMDITQLGASALVLGGTATTTLLTALAVGGGPYTTLDVAAMTVPVLSGGAMFISSNQGVTLTAQANVGDTTLHIGGFNPSKNYGVGSSISTNPYVGLMIDVANTNIYNQATYGYAAPGKAFMRKVNDGSLQSVADVTNRGLAELIQYSPARYIYHGMTNVELLTGQGIQVTSNTDGLSATTLLVQQVTAQWLGTNEFLQDVWEYQVDLGATNRAASSIMSHIFRQTTKNSSAPAITNTALMLLEKFSYVDVAQYPYVTTVLADAPTAYHRLGESSGTVAYDTSGNNFLAAISASGVTYAVQGAILNDPNTALTLNGSTGFVDGAAGASPAGFAAITLEAWINLANVSFGTTPRIISCDNTGTTHNGVDFFVQANGAGLTVVIGNGTVATTFSASYQFQAGVYYHVAATWSNSTNMLLYVNGTQLSGSGSRSGTIGTPAQDMTIGKNPATGTNFLPGTVDEVAWYPAQLSATRILKHYTVGITGKA
jgi:concanavalin A-like lectin/glucanase superfamily protein